MNPEQRIAELEKELADAKAHVVKLWTVIETACGVTAGFFPNGMAVIQHVSRLRKVEPQRGQIMVPGWRAKK